MSNRIDKIAGELAAIIKNADAKSTEGYDTPGTVRRIEGDTAWVHIPGGVDETPVKLTIAAKEGDTVQLRVAGGSAWLVGNQSAPPTDDATANRAAAIATKAEATAESVEDTANTANLNAAAAIKRAAAAQKIADTTNQYFWFVGTAFSLTEDTEVEEGKTYYQRVGEKYIAVVPEGTEDPSEQGWYEQTASDTGAHITEVPQDEFTDSPSGGNLLARSNGIAVREGLLELATFQNDGLRLYSVMGGWETSYTYVLTQRVYSQGAGTDSTTLRVNPSGQFSVRYRVLAGGAWDTNSSTFTAGEDGNAAGAVMPSGGGQVSYTVKYEAASGQITVTSPQGGQVGIDYITYANNDGWGALYIDVDKFAKAVSGASSTQLTYDWQTRTWYPGAPEDYGITAEDVPSSCSVVLDVTLSGEEPYILDVANFLTSGARVGPEDSAHVNILPTAMQEYGSTGDKYFEVGEAVNAGKFTKITLSESVTYGTPKTYTIPATPTTGTKVYVHVQWQEKVLTPGGAFTEYWSTSQRVPIFTAGGGAQSWEDSSAPFTVAYNGTNTITITATADTSTYPVTLRLVKYTTSTGDLTGPVYTLGSRGDTLGGNRSTVAGQGAAEGAYSAALGQGTVAYNEGEVAVGNFNSYDMEGNRVFSVGRGSGEDDREDAFVVRSNGDIEMYVYPGSADESSVDYQIMKALQDLGWTDCIV